MKGILYPTTVERICSIMGGERLFYSVGKNMNETAAPMQVLLYETKNSGGCGLITGIIWIGPGYEFTKLSVDHVAAMAYCPKETFDATQIGGKKRYFYEILHKQRLNEPKEIREVVWRGSTKAPRVWKVVEL